MGNLVSTSAPSIHLPPEPVIIKNSSVLACQDVTVQYPAGRPWEQPEGSTMTSKLTRVIKDMVPECLKKMHPFTPQDPNGTMHAFLFRHPDYPESGEFLITVIKSNEETVVYAIARTLGPIFVRQAILHANQLPVDSAAHLYHKQWNDIPLYKQYEKKCGQITVICKLVDTQWISAFVYDVLSRGFECRAAPLKDEFVNLLKDRFQQHVEV